MTENEKILLNMGASQDDLPALLAYCTKTFLGSSRNNLETLSQTSGFTRINEAKRIDTLAGCDLLRI